MKQFQISQIKKLREEVGLTITELSKKTNFSPQQIWNWENAGDKSLTTASLQVLAAALGKEPNDFFIET